MALMLFRKKTPQLDRRELLKSKPIHNERLEWEKMDDGEVMLSIPRRRSWWINLIARVFYVPTKRTVILDDIGSMVWGLCDGKNTVDVVISALRKEYKLDQKEAEVSTLTYLKQLAEKGLIGFAVTRGKKGETRK
jgi:hypothetical protein